MSEQALELGAESTGSHQPAGGRYAVDVVVHLSEEPNPSFVLGEEDRVFRDFLSGA